MKTCTRCGESKPRAGFHKDKSKADGLRFKCKACASGEYSSWYSKNRDQARATKADYYKAHRGQELNRMSALYAEKPHLWWVKRYRTRALSYGFRPVVESFTRDELVARWGDLCWHCGGDFEQLDHFPVPVVRGGHHTIENCRPSCAECNYRTWREVVPGDVG